MRKALCFLSVLAAIAWLPRTVQAQVALPVLYGFETEDASWTTQNPSGLNASEFGRYEGAAMTGSYGFRFSSYSQSGTSTQYLISPELESTPTGLVVKFWCKRTNYAETIQLGYSTTTSDLTSFTFEEDINPSQSWAEYEYTLPAGVKYVAWYYSSNYAYRVYLDDITLMAPPTCLPVTDLAASEITGSSFTLTWADEINSSASYTVSYWPLSSPADITTQSEATSPYTVSGLIAQTGYGYSVTANCSDDDSSLPASGTVATACEGYCPLPYSTNFDDVATGELPACWMAVLSGSNGSYGPFPSAYAYADNARSGSVYFEMESGSAETELVALPAMENISSLKLTFWASAMSSYLPALFEVGVLESDNSFTPVDTITFQTGSSWGSGYHEYTVFFASYEGSGERIALRATGSYGQYTLMMDDFYVSEFTGCYPVASLNLTEATSESLALAWTDADNTDATYSVRYCAQGSTDTLDATADGLTVLIDGLQANTSYWVEVTADCGSGLGDPVSGTFRTACGVIAIPYTEGFEDASALSCWQKVSCASNTGQYNGAANTGSGCFRFFYNSNPPQYLISPELTGTDNGVKVSFMYRAYMSSDPESFKVGYSTTGSDPADFTWEQEVTNITSTTYQSYSAIFPAGTKYVAIAYTAYYMYYLYIDDLAFMLPPDCMPVSGIAASDVTASSATLTWDEAEGVSGYKVTLGDGDTVTVGTNSYTFDNLQARTQYTAWVAPDCGDGVAEWSSFSFATDCATGSCEVAIATFDGYYGYAWEGNSLDVYQNGLLVQSVGYVEGVNQQVNVCAGIPVTFRWNGGGYWDDNAYFTIYDGGGDIIYSCTSADGLDSLTTVDNACPSCLMPSGLHATAIDSNQLSVAWTVAEDVPEYVLSFNGGDWMGASPDGTYTAYDLDANTVYTVSVKAVCVAGEDTSNARTITVRTACGQMALPYSEGFEGFEQGDEPSCWTVVGLGSNGYPSVVDNSYTGHSALGFASSGDTLIIASSAIPLPGDGIYVSFYGRSDEDGLLEVGLMTNLLADSTFLPIDTIEGSDYALYEFNTSGLEADSTYYLAFRFVGEYVYWGMNYAEVDDILIRADNGCMHPADLVATPDAHEIGLAWSDAGSVTDYVVSYRALVGSWSAPVAASGNSHTLTGLDAATAYEVRVGTLCGDDTLWVATSTQTNCDLMPLDYFEDFDAYAVDVLPPCWTLNNPSGVTHYDGGLFFRSNSGGANNYAVVPQVDGNFAKLQIELDVKVGNRQLDEDAILVGTADAAGNLLGWVDTLQDPNNSRNAFVHYTIHMVNFNLPVGSERLVFAQMRDYHEWALIDNISIIELPDCYPVTNLTGSNFIDPEATTFTWEPLGGESQWQVYVDTVTVTADDLADMPASSFTTVENPSYTIPIGVIQGGGIYNIFVRSDCGESQGAWVKNEFGAGSVVMNNSTVADTVTGCGFVVYDNGGPIAGYQANSNSALVLRSENVGSQLQVFGGKFGFGSSSATLTVYDGEGTSGEVLYTYNTIDGRDTLDQVLATSTTGALTITFSVSGTMCHTGYELYIRCVGDALCAKPNQLQAAMTSASTASVSWNGSADNYRLYYKPSTAANWSVQATATNSATLTGLTANITYDLFVVAVCSATDTSAPSNTLHFNSQYGDTPTECPMVSAVNVTNVTATTASVSWTPVGDASRWEVELTPGSSLVSTQTTHAFTDLTANTAYSVRVRTLCDDDLTSDWSEAVQFTTSSSGIDDIDASVVRLYPNPASTLVTIELDGLEGPVSVSIVDLNGRTCGSWQTSDGQLAVDLGGYARGAYFVRIAAGNASAVRKLVVR